MHYQIRGHRIRSENAAKSPLQTSGWVIDWINKLPKNYKGLDYGCGKLRYSVPLAKRISFVTAADSPQQIHRRHIIGGIFYDNLIEFAKSQVNNIKIQKLNEINWSKKNFDVILWECSFNCVNGFNGS